MNTDLVERLRKDFPYLFEVGFELSATNEDQRWSFVELLSDDFRIEFEILDGMLDVSIRHYYRREDKYGRWHGLSTYVELFEGHPVDFPTSVALASEDMKLLSHLLRQYMNKLQAFSQEGSHAENENKLHEIRKNISERNWKKLARLTNFTNDN